MKYRDNMTGADLDAFERELCDDEAMYAREAEAFAGRIAWFETPENALAFLIECHGGDDLDGEYPAPTEVISVESSDPDWSRMTATVRCADGKVRKVRASYHTFGGVGFDPPDVDVDYEYV